MPSIFHKAEPPTASRTPTTPLLTPSSNNRDITVNIIFGVFAVVFSLVTLWQGHRLWQTLRRDTSRGHEPSNGIRLDRVVHFWIKVADGPLVAEHELTHVSTTSSRGVADEYARTFQSAAKRAIAYTGTTGVPQLSVPLVKVMSGLH